MIKVAVIDASKQPLSPVSAENAHRLLSQERAAVFRWYPFCIILKKTIQSPSPAHLRLKIDPGSKVTGLVILDDATGEVILAIHLEHRANEIADSMRSRASLRRGRRGRKTQYRPKRFNNRKASRRKGLKQPCLTSRVANIVTWVKRLMALFPIGTISLELVRFDLQKLENPDISGTDYQHGTLWQSELMKYLLEKWEHKCAYCGVSDRDGKDFRWEADHFIARSKGGSDQIRNRVLSCGTCNAKKGDMDAREFLKKQPERLECIQAQMKAPLKDAAAVNSTRNELHRRLKKIGLPIECGSGGRTRWNRLERKLPKDHWIDAACVGASTPPVLHIEGVRPLITKAVGNGNRQVCRVDKYGFRVKNKDGSFIKPREHKRSHGFQTGDIVKVELWKLKDYQSRAEQWRAKGYKVTKEGTCVGRMNIDSIEKGSFYFGRGKERVHFNYTYCQTIQRSDGYNYRYA